ncbi:hypothetical protein [Nonomuraea sp. SYSU D8015]|uniref:hypothetical protein n=1 Tax=Nonomuraea sp. SYSU D8015 TaxID=2593644 RepID=UPI0016610981|nr:hypothetical protein [Nonomuraea sp. SYSU D8015]
MHTIQYGTRNADGSIIEHHVVHVPTWMQARGQTLMRGSQSAVTVYRVVREDRFSANHVGEAVTEWAELPADAAIQFGIADDSGDVTRAFNPDEICHLLTLHAHTGEGPDHGPAHGRGRIVYRAVTVDYRDHATTPLTEWQPLYPAS